MSSIWVNNSDEEASGEEEVANLCLVAREDGTEETLSDFESVHGDKVSLTDLQEAYNDIHREFHRMTKAFLVLKRKNKSLEMTVNSLSDELAEAKRLSEADIQGDPQVEPNVPSSE